jgi:hypothetical protein
MNIVPPQQQVSIAGASSGVDRCRATFAQLGMDLTLASKDPQNSGYSLFGSLTKNYPSPRIPFSNG